MTYSLLAIDEKTGALVAAAATGSLCVGGWVIRGRLGAGLVASQGTAPSTLWRDEVLQRLDREAPTVAVTEVTAADSGRAYRQLAALNTQGSGAAFTGDAAVPYAAHRVEDGLVVSGNMLDGPDVLEALASAWRGRGADPAEAVLTALDAAQDAGGDARGLLSAALLVLHPERPPLDLRIDHSGAPLQDLRALLGAARSAPYADWLHDVPTAHAPAKAPGAASDAAE